MVKCPSCQTVNTVANTNAPRAPTAPLTPFNLFGNFAQQIVRKPVAHQSAVHNQQAVVMGAPAGYAPGSPKHLPVTDVVEDDDPQATSMSTNDVPDAPRTDQIL